MRLRLPVLLFVASAPLALAAADATAQDAAHASSLRRAAERLERDLVATHGPAIRPRLTRGLEQVSALWRPEDGDSAVFDAFVRSHFAADERQRDVMFQRLQSSFAASNGAARARACGKFDRSDAAPRSSRRWLIFFCGDLTPKSETYGNDDGEREQQETEQAAGE